MPIRSADASWHGDLKTGNGTVGVASGTFEAPYSFDSRFQEGSGTNPEELIGAAHAGCYSMALANDLSQAGYTPTRVATVADVHLEQSGGGFSIPQIDLRTEAEVSGIDEAEFSRIAEQTKQNCPVSKVLSAATINLEAKLTS